MNFKTRVTFSTFICLFSLVALLITCVDFYAMNHHFYNYEYEQLKTAEDIGMSDTDLYEANDTLLDYIQDYRDDIKVKAEIQGVEREVFNSKETLHMIDVKNLYQGVMVIRNVLVLFVLFLLMILYYDDKKGVKSVLTYTYQRFFVLFALGVGGLITYAACDFTTFWTLFHKLFFTNELWLLDPNTSVMIHMFPESLFFTMVIAIAATFTFLSIFIWFYCISYQKKQR